MRERDRSLTDAELIRLCLTQDAHAWETLIRRYQRLIASIAFRYRLTTEDAEDIFQAVCITLYQQLPELRKTEKISSWLITVTVRECWKFRRRITPDRLEDEEWERLPEAADPDHLADESLLRLERQHLLRRGVESLQANCRELIERLFYQDVPASYEEISRQLGLPVASIGPTRGRCLEKLKKALTELGFF